MKKPKVSLVITNFNKGHVVQRAIRSCLNQILLREYVEVIVVDDGSSDNSCSVISEFGPEVKFVALRENFGVAYASNVGLHQANGDFWMRVDADDFLSAQACAFMGGVLESNPDFGYVYADHIRIDDAGRKVELVKLNSKERLFNHGAGVLFRTQLLKDVGGYDEALQNAEDYDLLIRIMKSGANGFRIPVALYRYYLEGSNLSKMNSRKSAVENVRSKHGM